jgi:hypothetical protein
LICNTLIKIKKMKNSIIIFSLFVSAFTQAQQFFTEDIVATKDFQGVFGSARLQIDDLNNDGIITRPLIVAEGFDSGLLGVENEFGESNIQDFIDEASDMTGNLAGEINSYDIIYVNWDNPRAHLQLNAYVLEEVINWVNQEKEPNADQNVVLGQSMGGVIARYALAYMEDDPNLDHDTKLYISHDAPHQGANIPLGIQYFARHLADQFIGTPLGDFSFNANDGEASIGDINALFNQPGTQQLLSSYIKPNFELDTNCLHDDWMAELVLKGYPTQTRNIAISNGSHCANTQEYDYNASLFKMNGNGRTGPLTDMLGTFLGLSDNIGLALLFNEPALVLGVLPGSSRFDLDFNARALPVANTTANIYTGNISYTKKIFWFLNVTVTLTDRDYNNPVSLSYDKYAGGRYELFDGVDDFIFPNLSEDDIEDLENTLGIDFDVDDFNTIINAFIGNGNINFNTEDTFGFIPVTSALDVGAGATILNNQDYFRVYNAANPPTGNLEIPFHNFITAYFDNSSENEQHISFNFRNGDWLAAELVENEQFFNCSYACGDVSINASSALCTSATFSVPEGADSVEWSVSPSNSGVSITSG